MTVTADQKRFLGMLLVIPALVVILFGFWETRKLLSDAAAKRQQQQHNAHADQIRAAQDEALAPFKDVNLDVKKLTLGSLRAMFGDPGRTLQAHDSGGQNLGWGCFAREAYERCALEAEFYAPNGTISDQIPASVNIELFQESEFFPGSINGLRLGDPERKLLEIAKQRQATVSDHGFSQSFPLTPGWEVFWLCDSDKNVMELTFHNTEYRFLSTSPYTHIP